MRRQGVNSDKNENAVLFLLNITLFCVCLCCCCGGWVGDVWGGGGTEIFFCFLLELLAAYGAIVSTATETVTSCNRTFKASYFSQRPQHLHRSYQSRKENSGKEMRRTGMG